MSEDTDLEALISLDGCRWEAAEGYVVEFSVSRTAMTPERPHGITYALVFRPELGEPLVRFDNAHAVGRPGGRFVKRPRAHDHWHRNETDPGRPYVFTSAAALLEDFWREVKRAMDERGLILTYKTGSIGEFMRWTKEVVADPAAAADAPRRWFDSQETAAKALGDKRAEALVKLLSEENIRVLRLIESRHPGSVRELAALAGRKESNLSRTLKKLEEVGIVGFVAGAGRTRAPRLLARRVTLDLDLVGTGSAVSIAGPAPR